MVFYQDFDELTLLNDAIEAGGMAWWLMEYPSGAVFFHPNKVKMLGYTEKDVEKFVHFSSFTDLVHPDDYEKAMNAMRDHLTGKVDNYQTSYRIKGKNGKYRRFLDRGKIVVRNKQGEVTVAGVVMDISNPDFLPKDV